MPKIFTSASQKIGETGENLAVKFLVKHDFSILDRNYTKKWGEIDIVAEKTGKIYFIEVKTVTCETRAWGRQNNDYRPEDNMHPWKLKRMSRTIQTYLVSHRIPENKEWQVDLIVVFLDLKGRETRVEVVSDIIL